MLSDCLNQDMMFEISNYLFHTDLRNIKFAFPKLSLTKEIFDKRKLHYDQIENYITQRHPYHSDSDHQRMIGYRESINYLLFHCQASITIHQIIDEKDKLTLICSLHEDILRLLVREIPAQYIDSYPHRYKNIYLDNSLEVTFVNGKKWIPIIMEKYSIWMDGREIQKYLSWELSDNIWQYIRLSYCNII